MPYDPQYGAYGERSLGNPLAPVGDWLSDVFHGGRTYAEEEEANKAAKLNRVPLDPGPRINQAAPDVTAVTPEAAAPSAEPASTEQGAKLTYGQEKVMHPIGGDPFERWKALEGAGVIEAPATDYHKASTWERNVANPEAFEQYRHLPDVAARHADISRSEALAADPFAPEHEKAKIDEAQAERESARSVNRYRDVQGINQEEMDRRRAGVMASLAREDEEFHAAMMNLPRKFSGPALKAKQDEATAIHEDHVSTIKSVSGYGAKDRSDPNAGIGRDIRG